MVISARNPVYSILFLVLVFCNAAGLLLLLETDFLAMLLLIVYVGAVAVLFLFVVMMLNVRITTLKESVLRYLPVGGLILFIFFFEVLSVINGDLVPFFSNKFVFF
jgi:NADH-quinone oxidoreductase subunit J